MMLSLSDRVCFTCGFTDMRKGLGVLARQVLGHDPFSGHLFVFRGRRGVQTSILDLMRDQLLARLVAQPALSAVDALERLCGLHHDQFGADCLRTVQRFMKVRRATMAREVLLGPLVSVSGALPDLVPSPDRAIPDGDTEALGNIAIGGNTLDGFTPSPDTGALSAPR